MRSMCRVEYKMQKPYAMYSAAKRPKSHWSRAIWWGKNFERFLHPMEKRNASDSSVRLTLQILIRIARAYFFPTRADLPLLDTMKIQTTRYFIRRCSRVRGNRFVLYFPRWSTIKPPRSSSFHPDISPAIVTLCPYLIIPNSRENFQNWFSQ